MLDSSPRRDVAGGPRPPQRRARRSDQRVRDADPRSRSSTTTRWSGPASASSSICWTTSKSSARPPTGARAWRWPGGSCRTSSSWTSSCRGWTGSPRSAAFSEELPDVEVVAMTSFIEEEKVTAALEAGAAGYLLKDAAADEVASAIRDAHDGNVHLDPAVARLLAQRMRRRAERGGDGAADRAGEGRPAPPRQGPQQQGDRGRPLHHGTDGADLRLEHPGQARARVADAGGALGRGAPPGRLSSALRRRRRGRARRAAEPGGCNARRRQRPGVGRGPAAAEARGLRHARRRPMPAGGRCPASATPGPGATPG